MPPSTTGIRSRTTAKGKTVWYARIFDHGTERVHGPFPTKTDAVKFRRKIQVDQDEGKHRGSPRRLTLSQLIDAYLPTLTHLITYKEKMTFAKFWKAALSNWPLATLKPFHIEHCRGLLLEGKWPHAPKQLTNATANRYLAFLSSCFHWGMENELIERNPCQRVKALQEPERRVAPLSEEDLLRLLAHMNPADRAICRLGYLTGLREAELFGLAWADIHLEEGYLQVILKKTQKAKVLHLPTLAVEILTDMESRQFSPFVFPSPRWPQDRHRAGKGWYRRHFAVAAQKAGLPGVKFHDLRATFSLGVLDAGGNIRELQDIQGWSNSKMAERYTKIRDSRIKKIMQNFPVDFLKKIP